MANVYKKNHTFQDIFPSKFCSLFILDYWEKSKEQFCKIVFSTALLTHKSLKQAQMACKAMFSQIKKSVNVTSSFRGNEALERGWADTVQGVCDYYQKSLNYTHSIDYLFNVPWKQFNFLVVFWEKFKDL